MSFSLIHSLKLPESLADLALSQTEFKSLYKPASTGIARIFELITSKRLPSSVVLIEQMVASSETAFAFKYKQKSIKEIFNFNFMDVIKYIYYVSVVKLGHKKLCLKNHSVNIKTLFF